MPIARRQIAPFNEQYVALSNPSIFPNPPIKTPLSLSSRVGWGGGGYKAASLNGSPADIAHELATRHYVSHQSHSSTRPVGRRDTSLPALNWGINYVEYLIEASNPTGNPHPPPARRSYRCPKKEKKRAGRFGTKKRKLPCHPVHISSNKTKQKIPCVIID